MELLKKDFNLQNQTPSTNKRLHTAQNRHFEQFVKKGLPNEKNKWWQFTEITNILQNKLHSTNNQANNNTKNYFLNPAGKTTPNKNDLHFHNGQLIKSTVSTPLQWCTWQTLTPAFPCWKWIMDTLSREQKESDSLLHLAYTFLSNGYILFVPEGYTPPHAMHIHSVFDKPQNPLQNNCNFIFISKGAKLTLVEYIHHSGSGVINTITCTHHGEESNLEWIKAEEGNPLSCHLSHTVGNLEKKSLIHRLHISLGSRFSRDKTDITHIGKQAKSLLLGLSILKNKNKSDHRSNVRHLKPEGTSRQFYRSILNDEAKGIFSRKSLYSPIRH